MQQREVDVLSLVAGIAFSGAGLVFLIDRDLGLDGRWLWPVLLIVVGVAGLVASRSGARGPRPQPAADPAAEAGGREGVEGGPGQGAGSGTAP